jgi:hypothetical protein
MNIDKIESGDTARIIKGPTPHRDGFILECYPIGETGIVQLCSYDLTFDCFVLTKGGMSLMCMFEDLELVEKACSIPNGTIVNGLTIESRREMHRKIAEQALEIDKLKEELEVSKKHPMLAEPEIPDWIARGKWVECELNPKYRKIKSISNGHVYWEQGSYNFLDYVVKTAKPFTPPPCPELPCAGLKPIFDLLKDENGSAHTPQGWLAMAQTEKWGDKSIIELQNYADWHDKWGD